MTIEVGESDYQGYRQTVNEVEQTVEPQTAERPHQGNGGYDHGQHGGPTAGEDRVQGVEGRDLNNVVVEAVWVVDQSEQTVDPQTTQLPHQGNGGYDHGQQPERAAKGNGAHRADISEGDDVVVEAVTVARAYPTHDVVPGFEDSASLCLNRALEIARSLNHTSLSSDHLMLALTMDPNARRHLERVGDVALLREVAMQRLGKMNWKFAKGGEAVPNGDPSPTSDFDEIRRAAREAAAERDQRIAISDLINAFPVENERLAYGVRDVSEVMPAVIDKIENALIPRVVDFMSQFEADVREGAQRQLAVALQDFGETKLQETVQRQIAALEENSRLMQERQIAAFNDFSDQFERIMEARLGGVLERFNERLQLAFNMRPQPADLTSKAPKGFWERFS